MAVPRRTRGRKRRWPLQTRRESGEAHIIRRDEGSGGSDGVVLDLTLVGDGIMTAVYTVPVTVGNGQAFQLQVDTGSSDLWIASKSCTTKACTSNKPRLYDPSSSSVPTNSEFQIQYLSGEVDGPIVWDRFSLGGYVIDNQALAAATNVVNESLTNDYSGILGLALPLDSVISKEIPPDTSSVPDGATVISNLFGLYPANEAPAQFFYSVLLARPNIDRIPSVLGIGRHPSNDLLSDGLTIDPSKVSYSDTISENDGSHFWKIEMRGINVYINGTKKEIDIGRSVTGNVFPEAVLDTGVPYIISTPTIANAVWGALGISPSSDGNYYVPCTTPLNMTITLDDRNEIPLHPLDLSAVQSSSSSSCVGLFQQSSFLAPSGGLYGDIILGVSFLRNVYTVMSYEPVSSNGTIENIDNSSSATTQSSIFPQLGLLNLTDPTTAMDEFNQVRVLNEPLGSDTKVTASSHGIPVGLKVLFGLLGFVVLCGALFGGRWLFMRRRSRQAKRALPGEEQLSDKEAYALAKYHLAPFRTHSYDPSEDTQKTLADPTARLDKKYDSLHSHAKSGSFVDDELGFGRSKKLDGDGTGADGNDDGDVVDVDGGHEDSDDLVDGRLQRNQRLRLGEEEWDRHDSWIDAFSECQPPLLGEWRPPEHERSYSNTSVHSARASSVPLLDKRRSSMVQVPLAISPAMPLEHEIDEFGGLDVSGLAGVGSGRRQASVAAEVDTTTTTSVGGRHHGRWSSSRDLPWRHSQSPSQPLLQELPQSHSRTSTATNVDSLAASLSEDSMTDQPPGTLTARPRPTRVPSGPRTPSMMSRVINAEDIT